MSNTLSKLKYSAIAASGAVLLMLGVTVSARAAIASAGVKSWAAGITLILTGLGLQTVGFKRLLGILSDEEVDRILQQRLLEIPKSCRGCQNFHGGRYGGVMLVCGIHPHGVKGDTCPDYETSKETRKV